MSGTVVHLKNVGKRYTIGGLSDSHDTLRDSLAAVARTPWRVVRQGVRKPNRTTFWALRDIFFDVRQGEVLGIIGPNGAGKSTVLKILSRVTHPTTGRIEISGRVGSLLEVGTGFHPELTGRENIFLNGAILGMTKNDIRQRFDEIVAFADVEQFLETPVKRYSTGMYMRLAFSVAAHLEPDILIVDEVLAVGDAAFQKKCFGRMRDISKNEGRTIIFVSHNMDAIQRLCSRTIRLDQGVLVDDGESVGVVARYLSANSGDAEPNVWIDVSQVSRSGSGNAHFVAVKYGSNDPTIGYQPYSRGPLEFLLAIQSDADRTIGSLAASLCDQFGTRLINADVVLLNRDIALTKGLNVVRVSIDELYLNPGRYRVALWLADPVGVHFTDEAYTHIESAFEIDVLNRDPQPTALKPNALVTCDFDVNLVPGPVDPSDLTNGGKAESPWLLSHVSGN